MATPTLTTTVPGNLGLLVDDETVILFDFAEPDGVAPADQAGTLEDLTPAVAGVEPFVEEAVVWAQPVARLLDGRAYVAADRDGASSLLTRDVSVQAIVTLEATGGAYTLICRGDGSAPAEYYAFGVEVLEDSPSTFLVRFYWQDLSGSVKTDTGASFARPPAETYILLTASRRWQATDSVVCRYYVGGDLIGESASSDGEIGGGTTGTTSIGTRSDGGFVDYWGACIDELKVTRHEMSPEEVLATWRRLAEHQPNGVQHIADLTPPGAPISRSPASRIQRLLRFIGQGLGLADARREQLWDVLPDRAYGPHLERWERICQLAPGPRDSVDVRRARVVAHLRRKGWTLGNVRDALLELFDLDAADIEVLTFSNTFTDPFASIRTERWTATPAASWSVLGGAARVQAALAADIRWSPAVRNGPTLVMPLHTSEDAYVGVKVTYTALPTDGEAGLYLHHGFDGSHFFFGLRNVGGLPELVYQRYRAGVAVDALPMPLDNTPAGVWWLRVRTSVNPAGADEDVDLALEWSTDGVTFSSQTGLVWARHWRWLGFYARGSDSSLAGALDVRFSEFLARQPRGRRPFCVYAYRDPGLPGEPDMKGARDLLRRFRHAYVHSSAITTRSLLCDDTGSGCDSGPMGGI